MDKSLSIAYFAFSEDYGANHAGFTHSYNIVSALAKLNVKVKAFFRSNKELPIENNLSFINVIFPSLKSIFKINPLTYFNSYFKVRKEIKDVDLVHERFHVNPVDLLFIKNKPYVLEINDPAMLLHDNFFYKYLINLKLKKCNYIITQSNTMKSILSKYTNKEIYVVSNGVDTSCFRPDLKTNIRDKYRIKKDEVLVIFVGAFMQWHGVLDVVKIAKTFPAIKFLMVGGGPEFEEVSFLARGVSNLILVGPKPKDEIPKFLAAADIAIAPFSTEKFKKIEEYGFWWCPVKLFEYMASGLPVVSYNYSNVRDIVKSGGLFAKAGNIEDFSNKLKKLIVNKNLRQTIGERARKISLKYDWKFRAEETVEVYKKCLEK